MKVLITGSSGFIGTNVVLAFKDRFDILCIDLICNLLRLNHWRMFG